MESLAQANIFLSRILAGDKDALERLYREQFPVIRGMVCTHGGTDADAKDIFQDALLVVYRKANEPGFELSSQFGTYLYSICRNLWFNYRTKKSASAEVTLPEDSKYMVDNASSIEAELLYVEQGNLFWEAFRKLGEDCQKILELFFQKIPMETIALQMGFGSEGYARRRKLQCKHRLVELIKNDPVYPELM